MPAKPLLVPILPPRPALGAVSMIAMRGCWGQQAGREGRVWECPSACLLPPVC